MMSEEIETTLWAEIDENSVVINVVVCDDEFVATLETPHVRDTSGDSKPPAIGDLWDGEHFVSPKPYPSWVLVDHVWMAPKPHPEVADPMVWDEDSLEWVEPPRMV